MFVRNRTALDARLARGILTDEVAVAALVVQVVYRLEKDTLTPLDGPAPEHPGDPPDVAGVALWDGVSVTVAGAALGPSRPPYVRAVPLRIGAEERRLLVLGDRRWEGQAGGGLAPSAPARFERIELGFERAFGGGYD